MKTGVLVALLAAIPQAASATGRHRGRAPGQERTSSSREVADLNIVRYRDPARPRSLWLGMDVGGVVVPGRAPWVPRTVWTVDVVGAWALALTRALAVGGRHGATWYGFEGLRMRFVGDQIEISGRPMAASTIVRHRDRIVVGFERHRLSLLDVDGTDFRIGGVQDAILTIGYGIEHRISKRFALAWQTAFRHVWVFKDTQRQVRVSLRASIAPRRAHRLAFETTMFYVNRDRDQIGGDLPRHSVALQWVGEYTVIGRRGLGMVARARLSTAFRVGEAPVYELRSETLRTAYGDLTLGFRAIW